MATKSRNLKVGGEYDWYHEPSGELAYSLNKSALLAFRNDQPHVTHVPYVLASFKIESLLPRMRTREFNRFRRAPSLLGSYAVEAFLFEEEPEYRDFPTVYAAVEERGTKVAIPASKDMINGALLRFGLENDFWMESTMSAPFELQDSLL